MLKFFRLDSLSGVVLFIHNHNRKKNRFAFNPTRQMRQKFLYLRTWSASLDLAIGAA